MAGQWGGTIPAGGGTVQLINNLSQVIFEVEFNNKAPWPFLPDGFGYTLVLKENPPGPPAIDLDPREASSWRVSSAEGGSPGEPDPAIPVPQVRVNELVSHSDLSVGDALELFNPSDQPADISGWFLTDTVNNPVKFQVPNGTIIPADDYLILTSDDMVIQTTPTVEKLKFSEFGDEVYLVAGDGFGGFRGYSQQFKFGAARNPDPLTPESFGYYLMSTGAERYPIQDTLSMDLKGANFNGEKNVGPKLGPLVITEILYNPSDGQTEFIEILNSSDKNRRLFKEDNVLGQVEVSPWKLVFGNPKSQDPTDPPSTPPIQFIFPTTPDAVVPPGGVIRLVRNAAGNNPAAGIYGPFPTDPGTGQPVRMNAADRQIVLMRPGEPEVVNNVFVGVPYIVADLVRYDFTAPWPTTPLTQNRSIERPNYRLPIGLGQDPANWQAGAVNGTPGTVPAEPQGVMVNEVLANSGVAEDRIEVFNSGNPSGIDISHWYLTDNFDNPKKYRIPPGTSLTGSGSGAYLVFDESEFNPVSPVGDNNPFSLSSKGEEAYLFSGNANGILTGYHHGFEFDASPSGFSIGLHTINNAFEDEELYIPLAQQTFGAANTGPMVGPIIINEIHYNPAGSGGLNEFLELRNIGTEPVDLFHDPEPGNPSNSVVPWDLNGGLEVDLIGSNPTTGMTLAPGQFLIVISQDGNETNFRTTFGIPNTIPIIKDIDDGLANGGERIAIRKPEPDSSNAIFYIDMESVRYDDGTDANDDPTGWPTVPDGSGPSLERINPYKYADTFTNWQASGPVAGVPNPGAMRGLTYAQWQTFFFTPAEIGNPSISGPDANVDGDLLTNLQEFAHGFHPTVVDAMTSPVTHAFGSHLSLSYPRNMSALGLTFTIQVSDNLSLWSPVSSVNQVDNGDGTATFTGQDTDPIGTLPRSFIRLHITD